MQPQLMRDYSLNLSILIGEGKETNKDFLSSGERKEKSSALRDFVYNKYPMQCMECLISNMTN